MSRTCWQRGKRKITLSLPGRISTVPILSMAIVDSNGSVDGRSNEDITRTFIRELFRSDDGQSVLRSLTVLPAVPDSGTDRVTMLFQPDREDNDDDCDCDDDDTQQHSCDPDGRYARSMVGLDKLRNRVVLPAYRPLAATDDDDDCDDCDDNSITWYEYTGQDWSLDTVHQKLEAGRSQSELNDHLLVLADIQARGEIVVVMSCDPD